MNNKLANTNNNIIFYTTDDGKINIEVYLEEVLEKIRDIRSSEKVFWRKILDMILL